MQVHFVANRVALSYNVLKEKCQSRVMNAICD